MKLDQHYTENAIRTYTGKAFDLLILDPDTICIEDIAHALARVPRFGGHLPNTYSVAQHSVMVSISLPLDLALAGLLHDASEAYLGDMPSPFKKLMPDYKRLESNLMHSIAKKFRFQYPLDPEIKKADASALSEEWNTLVMCDPETDQYADYWNAEPAEEIFLAHFKMLMVKDTLDQVNDLFK